MKSASKATEPTLQEQLDALKKENEALKAKESTSREMTLKVSEKGAVSLYGLGRFPQTLYQEQWQKVLGFKEQILAFIEANKSKLKTKD